MDSDVMAIKAVTSKHRVLPDGVIEFLIRVKPQNAIPATIRLMQPAGCQIAVVPLNDKPAVYGHKAYELHRSGFFSRPLVWAAIGTDDQFQDWVRAQPSAKSGQFGTPDNPIVFAHVRRVANGSGVAKKPPYSGIPLLNSEHQLQHQKGESAIGSKVWWDKQRIKCVVDWARETLKANLNYEHWNQVPPDVLRMWCDSHDLTRYLPVTY